MENTQTDMKQAKVLITGGLGFIGSNLAHRCVDLGAEVTILDNLDPRAAGNKHNVDDIRASIQLSYRDVREFSDVAEAVSGQDVVFHCAAQTSHANSMREPFENLDANCRATLNLLEALRRSNKKAKFVHIGTSTQNGAMLRSPVDEEHPEYPLDIYSAHKILAEKYALIYARVHGLRATVVRFANVFGPRAHIRTPDFGFINYFVGLGLQGKDLTVFGDGAQLRNVSFVEDCVEALLMLAQNEKSNGEVFFATADRQYSVSELARHITAHIGGQLRFVDWPKERKAIEVGDAVISNAKIRKTIGWRPACGLEEGLARTRDYYRGCLAHYL